jgi:hypothetical protein
MDFMVSKLVNFFVVLVLSMSMLSGEENHNYEIYVDEVIKSFANEMFREFNLICIGDGGRMPYDVETIQVDFTEYKRRSIEEARKLEVAATERFLKIINDHEKIRPFLREFPFTPKRVQVCISFNKKNDTYYPGKNNVAYMSLINGKIYYRGYDSDNQKLVDLFEEPYESALKIIKSTSP